MKAVSSKEMRRLDSEAIGTAGIPGIVLMENAGAGAARVLKGLFQGKSALRVLVMCGPGNNGGDGYVMARHLANEGFEVKIVATHKLENLRSDAALNRTIAAKMGLEIAVVNDGADVSAVVDSLGRFDIVCDALLGTGADRPLTGVIRDLVELANSRPWYKFALDVPTGVNADTGAVNGPAFRADATATFALPKLGLYLYPGAEYAGEIHVVEISIPNKILQGAKGIDLIDGYDCLAPVPARPLNAHKNAMGHLLLVAGAPGKAGAALLGGKAALRTGVGLCTLATHSGVRGNIEGLIEDLMVEQLDWDCHPEEDMRGLIEGKSALAVGPGIGTCQEARDLIDAVVSQVNLPLVLDADGINVYAGNLVGLKRHHAPTILTPHPGEMARLVGLPKSDVQADRPGIASMVASELQVVVVLKGAHTILAHPDGRLAMNLSGTPALAKAGAGDVLTGILGALLAMGMDAWEAAKAGVFLHGRCGERVQDSKGVHGLLASDLVEEIPVVMREWECACR